MSFTFLRWPFEAPEARLPEEEERWWAECYAPNPVQSVLESRSQWCVLLGGYQSGKSTALAALRRARQEQGVLILQEDFTEFLPPPLAQSLPLSAPSLLWRVLRRACWIARNQIGEQPHLLSGLSATQKEFLRWAIEKFYGRRAFLRWLDTPDLEAGMRDVEYQDIYPSPLSDVEGQIEELLSLGRRLGYRSILVLVDLAPWLPPRLLKEIRATLGCLEPMQHPGLQVVMALPPVFEAADVVRLCRGRAAVLSTEVSEEHTRRVLSRYLLAATTGEIQQPEQLYAPDLLRQVQSFLQSEFPQSEGSSPPIGAWLKATEILLEIAARASTLPLTASAFPEMRRAFYERFLPLRLAAGEEKVGVWRGYRWIPLERAAYEFLKALARGRGRPLDAESLHTSKGNLHTLASRLREAIEPEESSRIYLKNAKGEGYWLENIVPDGFDNA